MLVTHVQVLGPVRALKNSDRTARYWTCEPGFLLLVSRVCEDGELGFGLARGRVYLQQNFVDFWTFCSVCVCVTAALQCGLAVWCL